jgi:hypothetical protein
MARNATHKYFDLGEFCFEKGQKAFQTWRANRIQYSKPPEAPKVPPTTPKDQ